MIYKYIFLLFFTFCLQAEILIPKETKQLLVVSSQGFNSSLGYLQAYKKVNHKWEKYFNEIPVNLGRNGLAWGKGLLSFKHKPHEAIKQEGDGKAPAGLFSLDTFFGYDKYNFNYKYKQLSPTDLCIDDSDSKYYNLLIQNKHNQEFKSFEKMKRDDNLYALGITVGHNKKRRKQAGSCIFIHIQREVGSATAGCTSLAQEELLKLMYWLDKKHKPLLLQLPFVYLKEGFN